MTDSSDDKNGEGDPTSDASGEEVIATYKRELVAEAELARGDLDEIEDHLRVLASELRDRGMPRIEATLEACRRLGEPRAVAREHARVRSPFGARLTKLRAYSAVALIMPILIQAAHGVAAGSGLLSRSGMELALSMVLVVALAARVTWARPIVLAGMICFSLEILLGVNAGVAHPLWLVPYVGTVMFVMPWRRSELTASGLALALQVWSYAGASFALNFAITTHGRADWRPVSYGAVVAFFTTVIATTGGVLRARWGAVAGLVSAVALVAAVGEFAMLPYYFPLHFQIPAMALLGSGALAAAISAMLSWREARSLFGTLRYVLQ
ncbi:MAG: hypothetical protein ABJE66_37490 [Deltaproteobacteria bacterium]